jgi:surface antigen
MPSRDDRVSKRTGLVPIPGLKQSGLLSGPLPGGNSLTRPGPPLSSKENQAPATGQLTSFTPQTGQLTNANMTRVLTTTPPPLLESTSQRVPVVIKASMKRPAPAPPPLPPDIQKKRRLRVTLFGMLMLVLTIIVALFSATSLGHDIWLGNPLGLPGANVITGQSPGVSNLIAQATATAVYHRKTDGYDPSFFGSQLVGNGSASLNWPLGQCTYWANYEYHQLTGHWVSWNGNADQWVTGARQAGWNVSTSPHVPSIMVMMPYTQNASGYGHVAVVKGVSGNTVHTSNMNWWSNGGGWNRVSNVDFTVGPGIYFIWHS